MSPDTTTVCAIALEGPRLEATLAAVAAQTRRPDETIAVAGQEHATTVQRVVAPPAGAGPAAALEAGLRAGLEGSAEWFWLLDGITVPEEGALEALLAPLAELGDLTAPVLMASKVVGDDGEIHPDTTPWPRFTERDVTVDAARHGLMSLRAARRGSLLVQRRALEDYGLPHARYVDDGDDLEWTARLLQRESGFLAPRSVARRADGDRGPNPERVYRDVRNRADSLLGNATWVGEEKLWVGFLLAQRLAGELRAEPRPATARVLLRALSDGVRRRG